MNGRSSTPFHADALPDDPLAGIDMVIFDFDGVVADSEVISLETLREALAAFGVNRSLSDVRRDFLGTSLASIVQYVADQAPVTSADSFAKTWQGRLFQRFRSELKPMAGICDLLSDLERRGLSYCIASSGTHERIGVALDAMGMTARFPDVFSAEDVTHGKPAPDLFLHAADRMGVSPGGCVVVEDSPFGVRAARAAGMTCYGFVGGSHLQGIASVHAKLLIESGATGILASHDALRLGSDSPSR